jgi:hypothetical protein
MDEPVVAAEQTFVADFEVPAEQPTQLTADLGGMIFHQKMFHPA